MYINQTTSLFFRVTGRLNEGQAMLELSLLLPGDELSSPHYLSHKLIPCIRIKYAFSNCVHLFLESLLLSAATCKAYDWLNWGDEIETIKGIQSHIQKIWDQVVHVLWDSTTGAEIAWKRRRQLRSSWWGPVSSSRHQRQHERGGRSDNLSGEWYPATDNRDAFCTHCQYLLQWQWKFLPFFWAWPMDPLPFLWVWNIGTLDLGVLMSLIHIHSRLQPLPSHHHEKTLKEKWTLNNKEN